MNGYAPGFPIPSSSVSVSCLSVLDSKTGGHQIRMRTSSSGVADNDTADAKGKMLAYGMDAQSGTDGFPLRTGREPFDFLEIFEEHFWKRMRGGR